MDANKVVPDSVHNITTSLEALRARTRAFRDVARWNEPSIDIFPNTLGPVIRVAADGERELTMLKWGMPSPSDKRSTPGRGRRG